VPGLRLKGKRTLCFVGVKFGLSPERRNEDENILRTFGPDAEAVTGDRKNGELMSRTV
jgi:hypothetical protein